MIEMELSVDAPEWRAAIDNLDDVCMTALEAGAKTAGCEGLVSLLLADDARLQDLNKQFRGKDKPTDVLSFPAAPEDKPLLGDIAITFGVASKDAETHSKTLGDHLSHLLVHGLLHLIGHDHESEVESAQMEALEIRALASLGINNPYSFAAVEN